MVYISKALQVCERLSKSGSRINNPLFTYMPYYTSFWWNGDNDRLTGCCEVLPQGQSWQFQEQTCPCSKPPAYCSNNTTWPQLHVVNQTKPVQWIVHTHHKGRFRAIFQITRLVHLPPIRFVHLLQNRTFGHNWCRFSAGQMTFLSMNQPCKSTEENLEHWLQPVNQWDHPLQSSTPPHPWLIQQLTTDGRDVAAFMSSLQHQHSQWLAPHWLSVNRIL